MKVKEFRPGGGTSLAPPWIRQCKQHQIVKYCVRRYMAQPLLHTAYFHHLYHLAQPLGYTAHPPPCTNLWYSSLGTIHNFIIYSPSGTTPRVRCTAPPCTHPLAQPLRHTAHLLHVLTLWHSPSGTLHTSTTYSVCCRLHQARRTCASSRHSTAKK